MLKTGDKAPAFNMEGVDGKGKDTKLSLKDLKGKPFILYFYPRDSTPGCTTEACDFRDSFNKVKRAGAIVLGVSPDSLASHKRFQEKQGLNFPLLSDPDRSVAEAYGAFGEKKMYGKTTMGIIRSTFIIDAKGKVANVWSPVKVKGHVDEVLEALKGK